MREILQKKIKPEKVLTDLKQLELPEMEQQQRRHFYLLFSAFPFPSVLHTSLPVSNVSRRKEVCNSQTLCLLGVLHQSNHSKNLCIFPYLLKHSKFSSFLPPVSIYMYKKAINFKYFFLSLSIVVVGDEKKLCLFSQLEKKCSRRGGKNSGLKSIKKEGFIFLLNGSDTSNRIFLNFLEYGFKGYENQRFSPPIFCYRKTSLNPNIMFNLRGRLQSR